MPRKPHILQSKKITEARNPKRSSKFVRGYGVLHSMLRNLMSLSGFEISNWMHLSVGQVDCKNHLSECTIHLSEVYKAMQRQNQKYAVVCQTSPAGIPLVRLSFLLIWDDRTSEISNPDCSEELFPYITLLIFCHSVSHITSEPGGWGGN